MARKVLRRLLPAARELLAGPSFRRLFGRLLSHPDLWHLSRQSVAWAVSVGLFMAFVPLPSQMLLAAAAAIWVRCNLPIAVCVVWISNPVTMAPLFFAAYKTGAWLTGVEPRPLHIELSLDWLLHELGAALEPLLLGCLTLGLITGLVGHVAVRLIWRIHVIYSWRERAQSRAAREMTSSAGETARAKPDGKPGGEIGARSHGEDG